MTRVKRIMGIPADQDSGNLRLSFDTNEEAQLLLLRMRDLEQQLLLVKQEVIATASFIKAEPGSGRSPAGKSIGAAIAAGFLGRKPIGQMNATEKERLRREQDGLVQPYEAVKADINQFLATISRVRGKIQFPAKPQAVEEKEKSSPLAVPPTQPTGRFYAFIDAEVKGPYTIEQVRALRETYVVTAESQICREGSEEWLVLEDLPEFKEPGIPQ